LSFSEFTEESHQTDNAHDEKEEAFNGELVALTIYNFGVCFAGDQSVPRLLITNKLPYA